MGHKLCNEQALIKDFKASLRERGVRVKKKDLVKFFLFVDLVKFFLFVDLVKFFLFVDLVKFFLLVDYACPWFLVNGPDIHPKKWQKIGKDLNVQLSTELSSLQSSLKQTVLPISGPGSAPPSLPHKKVPISRSKNLKFVFPVMTRSSKLTAPPTDNSPSSSAEVPAAGTDTQDGSDSGEEDDKDENENEENDQAAQDTPPRKFRKLNFKTLKDLNAAVKAYGPNAPFTLWALEAMSHCSYLLPSEWVRVVQTVLSQGQFLTWKADFFDCCQSTAAANLKPPQLFLGFELLPNKVLSQKNLLRTDCLYTLNDFQKLLGDINWLRPYLKLTMGELKPLFDILRGDPDPSSPRSFTPEARKALTTVEHAIHEQHIGYYAPNQPFWLLIFPTPFAPTGLLWQQKSLFWVHLSASPSKILPTYPHLVATLLRLGRGAALKLFGRDPDHIVSPYTTSQVQWLVQNNDDWATSSISFQGTIDNHFPSDKLTQFLQRTPVVFPQGTKSVPIKGARLVFTDGSASGIAAFSIEGQVSRFKTNFTSAQLVELAAIIRVFELLTEPFNLYTDSSYVAHSVPLLETAPYIRPLTNASPLFAELQHLILARTEPFFISHIRAHSGLPGPLAEGNDKVDQATQLIAATLSVTPLAAAQQAHALHHLNANTLRLKYSITREQARQIVRQCKGCLTLLPEPHLGINPRGLVPGDLWQMDVTHHPPFGKLKYIHVSIDTFSGFIFASLQTGEASKHMICHVLASLAVAPRPKILKTDNGPGYTSSTFKQFCAQMEIKHITGIPYNPQGQGIVKRAHQTLKNMISKLQSGEEMLYPKAGNFKTLLNHAMFVLNFLTYDIDGKSAADRLWHSSTANTYAQAMWRDPLSNRWQGPDPVLIWGKGHACIYDSQAQNARWLPERLIKLHNPPRESPEKAFSLCLFSGTHKMSTLTFGILLCWGTVWNPSDASQSYQAFNYTWMVMNMWGNIIWSTSRITASDWWPTLYPDLCKLALGAPPDWDLVDYLNQQKAPSDTHGPYMEGAGGCSTQDRRTELRTVPFYVCPGTHRDRSLIHECGGPDDYYCRSWGCETTGDTYWNPSSPWDYITVTANYTHHSYYIFSWVEIPECSGWCHPLKIQFTDPGKKYTSWTQGVTWGLRLYKSYYDDGLIFTIKLLKGTPGQYKTVAIGPNPELHPGPGQGQAHKPALPPIPPTPPYGGMFRPTLPKGPPSSAELILSLINTSVQAVRKLNNTLLKDCWVCYSSSPPFYEGIAHFGNPVFTNDPSPLHWGSDNKHGLTLSKITGLGLCLLGPNMLPPLQLREVCDQTITITPAFTYVAAPNDSYLACSSGLTTFIVTTHFVNKKDYCVVVSLFPHLTIHDPDDFLRFWERGTDPRIRKKREPLTAVTLAVLIGLGSVGAGTGIASLVTSNNQYAQLSAAIDKDLQELQSGLEYLKDSVASLAEVVLQNRRGLDLLFLQQGGLCAALKEECCFYTDKLGLVENSIQKIKESLEKRKNKREQQESWYQNWFSTSPWLSTLLPSLLGPLVGLLLLLSFGPWAFNKLTSFVKSQVNSALRKPIAIHYIDTREGLPSPTIAPEGLRFSTLAIEIESPWYLRVWRRLRETRSHP
ncbi:uncharacterized protein LOC127549414 [Antechinus flavipes]|uniref:uncharacterized protein LOC127549414 n=1 Tax=Antechinus flavipes TaxID=38775 RepID=UPI002236943E|nr:uncharacterized protein LOC127549414 [Antechinus flavipes]